jgi:hypothetical protein
MVKKKNTVIDRSLGQVGGFIDRHYIWASLTIIVAAALIFALRNLYAFTSPNFYAEDATVLFSHIFTGNPLRVLVTAFNGYLIVGQYLLAYLAAGLNFIIGNHLDMLPTVTATVSCTFLGFVASLPFILFRKKLGVPLSLLLVLLTALIPLASYDYAIIGTISNLKFPFLYIAFLLVIYRLTTKDLNFKQYLLIDVLLFVCVLTNATAAFLVPVILFAYYQQLRDLIARKKINLTAPMIGAIGLTILSGLYVLVAVVKGIPKIPGYLDGPFNHQAILPIIDRSTFFGIAYPITSTFNTYFVIALLIVTFTLMTWLFIKKPETRLMLFIASWAIFLGTGLFVLNRPGIGDLYLNYMHKGGPDQFFYAQNMIFIFALGWIGRDFIKKLFNKHAFIVGTVLVLYLLLALPQGTSFGQSAVIYKDMKPIQSNIDKACRQYADQDKVILQIYPTTYWQWRVDKKLACN